MGSLLGELHFSLWIELTWVHLKWKDYRALFAVSPERIGLFNNVAPTFFGHLQNILWDDVLLHLCRLTDREKTFRHAHLTINQLPMAITDAGLLENVKALVTIAEEKTTFARDWRNRRLAHRELPDFDEIYPKPLAPASRQYVEEALAAIRDTMNCVQVYYQKSMVGYEHSVQALGGVESLVLCLEKGLAAQRDRNARGG
jgi:hypothetical protein